MECLVRQRHYHQPKPGEMSEMKKKTGGENANSVFQVDFEANCVEITEKRFFLFQLNKLRFHTMTRYFTILTSQNLPIDQVDAAWNREMTNYTALKLCGI